MAREYLSIGEVLVRLKPEFPDVTISKIRFLETEGLIAPGRTESGYRKFYEEDVERLREILRLQRDEYLPLRVIKDRLARGETVPVAEERAPDPQDEVAAPMTDVQMSAAELADATGVAAELIEELDGYGLLTSRAIDGGRLYDGENLAVITVAKEFFKFGVEPRHLTMYRHFADREASLFEAIIMPTLRQRNPEARRAAAESLAELAGLSRRLKQALLRANLRRHLS